MKSKFETYALTRCSLDGQASPGTTPSENVQLKLLFTVKPTVKPVLLEPVTEFGISPTEYPVRGSKNRPRLLKLFQDCILIGSINRDIRKKHIFLGTPMESLAKFQENLQ